MTTLVAPVMGPLLGGWITDNISWPWIFYINIPVGAFAAVVTWSIYAKRETARRKLPIDGVGLALLIVWVGSLQVMLDRGQELDCLIPPPSSLSPSSPRLDSACSLSGSWWRTHTRWWICGCSNGAISGRDAGPFSGYGVFFGNVVVLPLWLQQYMGYTATEAGLLTAPVGIFALLLSPLVGRQVGKTDPRLLGSIAFLIFAVSLYMRTRYNTQANFGFLVVPIIVQGAAMAFFFVRWSA